jgi:hypothetical protein
MTRTEANVKLMVLNILRFAALVVPSLLVSDGLLWSAEYFLGATVTGVPFVCAFALGAITMFTIGFRLTDYVSRRTDGIRKRALEALKTED